MSPLDGPKTRSTDAAWFAVLDRFGLPTLLLLLALWKGSQWVEADRAERSAVLAAMAQNLDAQTALLRELVNNDSEHAEALKLLLAKVSR